MYLCLVKGYWQRYCKHYKDITKLSGPIMVAQLGTIFTSYADTIMVGHYTTQSLAAASFVTNAFNFIILLSLGFSYGITPLVGARLAQEDDSKMGTLLRNITATNLLFGILLLAFASIFYALLEHLGQPPELLPLIRPYYIIIFASMPPIFLMHVCRQFCDALGHTSLGMWIFTTGNLLNIVGNYMFIFGHWGVPELGLNGAGWSSLGARIFMCMTYMAVIMHTRRYRGIWKGFLASRIKISVLKDIARTSSPVSLQMGLECGIFTVALIVVGWFGTDSLAAYQIILMLGNLGFMIYYAFGAGTAIKISHYNGTNNHVAISEAAHAGYALTLAFTLIACFTFIVAGDDIIGIFTSDQAVIDIAASLILPLVLYQLGDATQIIFANTLRGIGSTLAIMKGAIVAYLLVGVPLIYLLAVPAHLKLTGIYLAFFVSLLTAGLIFHHQFHTRIKSMPSVARK